MQEQLKGAAWALGLWGAFSIIFGLLILAWPSITLKAFLVILGVYLIATGLVVAVGSLANREGHWVGGSLIGVLSVIAGLYVFSNPTISALAVLTVIAIWALAAGVLEIVAGFEGNNDWWMVFSGLVLAVFGLYIFANPKGGAIALIWIIGLATIISGVALVVSAFRANSLGKQLSRS